MFEGWEEWANRSKDGLVCGMLNCPEKPTSKCPICFNHYCFEHLKYHFHVNDKNAKRST